ncbi:hypothetical protein NB644_09625 [Oxalobacter formigenes]|uniref:hypothetical protein n=1 Tax=Oxalobacter formigenes TaxID=847 RepID=UPI0022AEC153|nr:hypothetical protein [Oxalobacter formigenes]WAW01194.1 hypothetical protein NB644_09625 [Oxalobacter formigenes]WAW03522.1 hypothetical protein NB642_10395 [Oxalobacter formigenes]
MDFEKNTEEVKMSEQTKEEGKKMDELIERLEHLKDGFEKIRDAALNLSLSENLSDFRNGVRMNTKLTEYQNQKIADVLCEMALCGETPDKIKEARRLLVTECEEVNLATEKHALWREGPLTATEAVKQEEIGRQGVVAGSPDRSPI